MSIVLSLLRLAAFQKGKARCPTSFPWSGFFVDAILDVRLAGTQGVAAQTLLQKSWLETGVL
jgi:hypothetical protein